MQQERTRTRLPPRLNETSLSGPPVEPWPLALFFDDCRRTTALVSAARPLSSCAALAERHTGESIRSRLSLFDKTRQVFDRTRQHLVWAYPTGCEPALARRRFASDINTSGNGPFCA